MNKSQSAIAILAFFVLGSGVVIGIITQQSASNTAAESVVARVFHTDPINPNGILNLALPAILERNVNSVVNQGAIAGATTSTPSNLTTPTPARPSSKPKPKTTSATTKNVEITFYGAYDNDPPGSRDISDPVKHQLAGGTGTYADPMTFASPSGSGAYAVGTIIYVPRVQKYFIKEDECATSWTAPNGCGAVSHVDLYIGNPSDSKAVLACEDALTPDGNAPIIIKPASNLKYDPTPMWNQATGVCMRPHI